MKPWLLGHPLHLAGPTGTWPLCEVLSLPVFKLTALLTSSLPGGWKVVGLVVLHTGWGWWGAHWDPVF